VRGVNGWTVAAIVLVNRLGTGALHLRDLQMPVLARPVVDGSMAL
jgi:hypothetical protein